MKRSFTKVIFRDLKKNASRFIAIIAIMFLGVSVLIGLLSCTPVLESSVDKYYKDNYTYDINIKSTIGFDDEDIKSITDKYSNVDKIEAFYQMDLDGKYKNQDITVRKIINSFDNEINKLNLIKGRLPEAKNECVVLRFGTFFDEYDSNSKIKVDNEFYQIVGVVESSVYYYRISEIANAGDGDLEAIIYLDSRYNEFDVYTDVVVTIKDAIKYSCFDDKYLDFIETTVKSLENDSEVFINERINRLKEEAYLEAMETASNELKNKITEELNKYNITGSMFETLFNKYYEEQLVVVEEEVAKTIEEEFKKIDGTWYVLDRNSNISFKTFKVNAKKVDQIGVIFPVFFFFIAALISLTSMTRMITEERMSIGTLKSLGYSRGIILYKYLCSSFVACVIGSLTGVIAGVFVLPSVIYIAYKAIYIMPSIIYLWNIDVILLSALSMSLTILIVTTWVCISVLNEKPNALLIPRAPKSGKKILLEKITFIWRKLKFKYKSSIRNVFRFKRNLIMMVVGIGGTTGLLIVGFGIDNSIGKLPEDQFENILRYDAYVETTDIDYIKDLYSDSAFLEIESYQAYPILNEDYKSNLYYTNEDILDYINLGVEFNEDSVVVSKQLAITFDLEKGSIFKVKINDEIKELKVTNVFENYINNYIIVHESLSGNTKNSILIKYGQNDIINESEIIKNIYDSECVKSVEILTQTRSIYKSLSDSMDMIIFVLIFASGALAVIVIYNLTNINIDERIREIATLKVLGYQNNEVCGYIYREIIIMSFFGILLGLLIGPALNYFVLSHLDNVGLCCKTSVEGISLIYSVLITIIFVIFVLFMFIPKIKKVHMVESLKSVE